MTNGSLSPAERHFLLQLARQTILLRLEGKELPPLDPECLPPGVNGPGACFVTLTRGGELRGCVGALEAYQSLAEDVVEHAEAAAFEDYRFPPLRKAELPGIKIEISYLTAPTRLAYDRPEDLLACLRPGIDGLILRDGVRRATFLPQVWEQIPDPATFLSHLCLKMGVDPNTWRCKPLQAYIYQVESFEEQD